MSATTIRAMVESDVKACSQIVYDAFRTVAERHGFQAAFPTIEVATRVVTLFVGLPSMYKLIAEHAAHPVGAIFLDEGDPIRAIAIVAVDPAAQARGVGRALMDAALERARDAAGVRLVQEAYNVHALGLYASLGFSVKEPLVRLSGRPRSRPRAGVEIRSLTERELPECEALYRQVHGITRTDDLRDGLRLFRTFACLRAGRIVAHTYAVFGGILAWGIAKTDDDMQALLHGVAAAIPDPLAFHLPTRQERLLRWCLDEGFRIEKPLTLMARGEYHEPRGCWFPSGFY